MRRVMLSHPVPVFALVSRYLTNKLIGRSPLPRRTSLSSVEHMGYYPAFPPAIPHLGVRSIALLALSPLPPKRSLNLHVLAMPPAFNLSQDQTLQLKFVVTPESRSPREVSAFDPAFRPCPIARGGAEPVARVANQPKEQAP